MCKDNYHLCFRQLPQTVMPADLPDKFTYPLQYEPHPVAVMAAHDLQQTILTTCDLEHNFGITDDGLETGNSGLGKMFGVLIVITKENQIGYLAGYSGKLGERNDHPNFVPPIVDLLHPESFYRKEEALISEINREVENIETDDKFIESRLKLTKTIQAVEEELSQERAKLKRLKAHRKNIRTKAEMNLPESEFRQLCEQLKTESLEQQHEYKKLALNLKQQINDLEATIAPKEDRISRLKTERKERSAALQQKIFDSFSFLNFEGETRSLTDIFVKSLQKTAPAGAGECAAPKLLQYAFAHSMKPVALAEFWWGCSPESEIRKHGHFYPACRGKCGPILAHMLKGLQVDENPLNHCTTGKRDIQIIFEDEWIAVINKPPGLLTVPGKEDHESLYSIIKEMFPKATGPLCVHRLDMATSGIVLIAKTESVAVFLQKQFIDRKVEKRYVALLDGMITEDSGIVKLPLRVDIDNRPHQLVCYQYGKPAVTRWKVAERSNNKTRVTLFPVTGRTHQLRVHMAHQHGLNTAIVGDDLYGQPAERLYLHAEYIRFTHPHKRKLVTFTSEPDF
ncbi:MAG: pseudouridine synthase [Spirochaetes bacterium]|jgi:tRNA pseudouridine32 synthase/23S rRNA pseudouridine746 synthase|nr:pseudouridine synthase [Spirochaetota bacterium]